MTAPSDWPAAELIQTSRLQLEPLRIDHADEMAPALDDPHLHEFTGGEPASLDELRHQYSRMALGRSTDGSEGWLNWIARHRDTGAVVGTVQATLFDEEGRSCAEVAWVVAAPYQGQGLASEAAMGMVQWLRNQGVLTFVAHIHPDHAASNGVAAHLGLRPTDVDIDGETLWTS